MRPTDLATDLLDLVLARACLDCERLGRVLCSACLERRRGRIRNQVLPSGLTATAALEYVPDGRELVLPRYTQPEPEHRLVLEKLGWELPPQPPPRIRAPQVPAVAKEKETKSKM